jgi:hypothetical protein
MVDENGRVTERPWAPVVEGSVFRRHLRLNFGTGSSPLIRRSSLGDKRYSTELSTLSEGGSEDWLLQLQLAAEFDVACTRAYLLGYRDRTDSMSADTHRMMRSYILMYEMLGREFGKREGRVITGERARWRVIYGLSRLGQAPANALFDMGAAFFDAPTVSIAALCLELSRRFNPLDPSRSFARHPSVGQSFFDLSPDVA